MIHDRPARLLLRQPSTKPYYNIALEDYLYRQLRPLDTVTMLWVNRPSVFMGRYQCLEAELDMAYLEERQIALLRRSSGGGTVYHDLGNLNFSVISNDHTGRGFDLQGLPECCADSPRHTRRRGRRTLATRGSEARRAEGRRRCRGHHAQPHAVPHHLLFDTDLDELERILTVPETKRGPRGLCALRGDEPQAAPPCRLHHRGLQAQHPLRAGAPPRSLLSAGLPPRGGGLHTGAAGDALRASRLDPRPYRPSQVAPMSTPTLPYRSFSSFLSSTSQAKRCRRSP